MSKDDVSTAKKLLKKYAGKPDKLYQTLNWASKQATPGQEQETE
jgi:hypothetical protein